MNLGRETVWKTCQRRFENNLNVLSPLESIPTVRGRDAEDTRGDGTFSALLNVLRLGV